LKIAYITTFEILGSQNSGGVKCCNHNLWLLRQAFGEENIQVCAITKHKEYLDKATANITPFFTNRSRKIISLKNSVLSRLMYSKSVEDAVFNYIMNLNCDLVFFESTKMGLLQKRLPKEIPQAVFMHTVELEYLKNELASNPLRILLYHAVKLNETLAIKHADKIITLNDRDTKLLEKYYNRTADITMPISMEDEFDESKVTNQNSNHSPLQLLFVGSLFPPNEHGVKWFVDNVMPNVKAKLTIIGRDFEKLSGRLSRSNVKVVGTVDDLSDYYYNADAVVSPILFGDGMKVKTAEALMYGKPMFATDEALEGYEVEGQKNVRRCNSAHEFIETINHYSENKPYSHFDENIRSLFLKKYHSPKYVPLLHGLLSQMKRTKEN